MVLEAQRMHPAGSVPRSDEPPVRGGRTRHDRSIRDVRSDGRVRHEILDLDAAIVRARNQVPPTADDRHRVDRGAGSMLRSKAWLIASSSVGNGTPSGTEM